MERVVIGDRDDAGAQPDMPRAFGQGRDEHFGRTDEFIAAGMVFPDPEFIEPQPVEQNAKLKVTLQRQRRIRSGRVIGSEEISEAHRMPLPVAA
jgi:hypothetical protein